MLASLGCRVKPQACAKAGTKSILYQMRILGKVQQMWKLKTLLVHMEMESFKLIHTKVPTGMDIVFLSAPGKKLNTMVLNPNIAHEKSLDVS